MTPHDLLVADTFVMSVFAVGLLAMLLVSGFIE